MVELLYRRCSELEANEILNLGGLPGGNFPIKIYGLPNYSDSDKWVSKSKKFADLYSPNGVNPCDYNYCVIFFMYDGTLELLAEDRLEGLLKRGPRSSYGIPFSYLDNFNLRIKSIKIHNMDSGGIPDFGNGGHRIKLLRNRDTGNYSTFMALPHNLINSVGDNSFASISSEINKRRMSWVKTSLIWTLWRSNFGKNLGYERIIQFDLPVNYLQNLFDESEDARKVSKSSLPQSDFPLIHQYDPDRQIHIRRWNSGESVPNKLFIKSGSTCHFGLRNSALRYFLGLDEYSQRKDLIIKDITPKLGSFLNTPFVAPETQIYDSLGLYVEEL